MYCYHCGYELDEHKVEASSSTMEKHAADFKEGTEISYVCPRCGHLIHKGEDETDLKSLARASHAEIQRGRNSQAYGMGMICIGMIALILAGVFLKLSFKPGMQNQFIAACPEFIVCVILAVCAVGLLPTGLVFAFKGHAQIRHYESLLRDIHNQTFFQ
jgi:hypothetical protein